MTSITIRSVTPGTPDDQRSGLLAYVTIHYGALTVDGICVRRTATGRLALSFPQRRDRLGRTHAIVRPVDDDARRAIEREVLAQSAQVLGVLEGVEKEGQP